jgi:hypothetical protein
MSKHRVLSLKPHLRLERRGQDGQNETEQPNHSASLGDSITSSTRIEFLVHTGIKCLDLSSNSIAIPSKGCLSAIELSSDQGLRWDREYES